MAERVPRLGAVRLAAPTLVLALAFGVFVHFHSGSRADALCSDRTFVSQGELSLTHFGVACEFGLPPRISYERGWSFIALVLVAIVWLAIVVAAFAPLRR